jgi:hypothetical protein
MEEEDIDVRPTRKSSDDLDAIDLQQSPKDGAPSFVTAATSEDVRKYGADARTLLAVLRNGLREESGGTHSSGAPFAVFWGTH